MFILFLLYLFPIIYSRLHYYQEQQQQQGEIDINLVVLDHSNVYSRYPDTSNKVMCQKIIDRPDHPIIIGADDLIIPNEWQLRWGIERCNAMTLSFTTVRTRNDLNPYNITLLLFRNNQTENKPGNLFYKRTFQWPTNNVNWVHDIIAIPSQNDFILNHGDLDDDGITIFDLQDPAFLSHGSRIWVSFYATIPWHMGQSLRTNSMYWATLENTTGSSLPTQFKDNINANFFYRDEKDLEKYGFIDWTDSSIVSPYIGIRATTNQMAWKVTLHCRGIPPPPTLEPMIITPEPTTIPTQSPTMRDDNITNETMSVNSHHGPLIIGIIVPFTIVSLLVIIIIIILYAWRKRKRRNDLQTNINAKLNNLSNYEPIPQNPLTYSKTSTSTQIYTDGTQFRNVQLHDKSKYPDLFNNKINTTDDDII